MNSITDFTSVRKHVVSSAYAVFRNVFTKILRPLIAAHKGGRNC